MSILIISGAWDLHAEAVAWALRRHGVDAQLLDLSRFPAAQGFSLRPTGTIDVLLDVDGQVIDLGAVRAVWCRRPLEDSNALDYSGAHPDDLHNIVKECSSFARGVYCALEAALGDEVIWANSYAGRVRQTTKPVQLIEAQRAGMSVAPTLMSNSPARIRAFYEGLGGRMIVKPFSPSGWRENGKCISQPTVRVEARHLVGNDALRLAPAIYQPMLHKAYELRILVLGQQIHAVKIDSQRHEHSRMDWRLDAGHHKVVMSLVQLDDALQSMLLEFMHRMQLRMGSIDMIVDPAGTHHFLEVNQQGQFLFLEQRCPSLSVLKEVTTYLADLAGHDLHECSITFSDYLDSEAYREMRRKDGAAIAVERPELRYVAKRTNALAGPVVKVSNRGAHGGSGPRRGITTGLA